MGSLQLEKSGRWTIRVGFGGKRYSRSARTTDRAQAERFLQRFLAPLGLGERRLPLADVWNEYIKSPNRNELARSTLESKRNVWMGFAQWMEENYLPVGDLGGITSEIIAEYLATIRTRVCASTYNARVCVLREIFRVLSDKAGLDEDPWGQVRLRPDDSHSRRELTKDELARLLNAADGDWRTLFLIGIYTGLRLGDCCQLDWSQVDLARGIIQLIPQKTRRHAHSRPVTIPIHPVLQTALEQMRKKIEGCHQGPCVLEEIAQMYQTHRPRVSDHIAGIFKAAGIETSVRIAGRLRRTPEATFHSLRHTFVSFAANAGVPLSVVQAIVGHESTAMTRHYYHESVDALRAAVRAIPSL